MSFDSGGSGFSLTSPFRLPAPCLMLVTDRTLYPDLVGAVDGALSGGVDVLQLRDKSLPAPTRSGDLPDADLLRLARQLRQVSAGRALLVINGSLDVALAVGADGVHLPQAAPLIERPRPDFLLGRSVHSLDEALAAEAEGLDYLIAGPVFATRSHPAAAPAGPSLIEAAARAVALPVLAIGGVSADNVGEVVAAGASGVAVISAVLASADPEAAARQLRRALDAAWARVEARR